MGGWSPAELAWLARLCGDPGSTSLLAALDFLSRRLSAPHLEPEGGRDSAEWADSPEIEGAQGAPGIKGARFAQDQNGESPVEGSNSPKKYQSARRHDAGNVGLRGGVGSRGRAGPGDERLRLRHSASLGFQVGEVVAVEVAGGPEKRAGEDPKTEQEHEKTSQKDPEAVTVVAALFGLCGAASPLPLYLAEEAAADDPQGAAIRGLLDVFHHRLLSLLIAGLRAVDLPRALDPGAGDPWSRRLFAYLGIDGALVAALPRARLLRLAPLMAAGVRSPELLAAALRIALGDDLGPASLRVEPFTGGWMAIDSAEWSLLGSPSARLGETLVAGTEILHPAGAASIVIGPLTSDLYPHFTRGNPGYTQIKALTAAFTPSPLHYDLVLEVVDHTYPPAILGERHLGGDFWLAHSAHGGVTTEIRVGIE